MIDGLSIASRAFARRILAQLPVDDMFDIVTGVLQRDTLAPDLFVTCIVYVLLYRCRTKENLDPVVPQPNARNSV